MINELKDSLMNEIEKRVKNPFLGAFIISWIFWNWDFLYVSIFLDEKYVSLLPQSGGIFSTKFEYIKNNNLINLYKFIIYPLGSSVIVIIFIEWITTGLNLIILTIKNKILGFELLTKEESLKIKNDFVESKSINNKLLSQKNDEILFLESKVSDLEIKIDEKVNEKIKLNGEKNLERIKELEDNLSKSEIISSERLEKNKKLDTENRNLNKILNEYKNKENIYIKKNEELLSENGKLKLQNNEIQKRLSLVDKPLDEKYRIEYEEFKNSSFFNNFDNFIEEMETNPYSITRSFYGKDIKYLKIKGIISEIIEDDISGKSIKFEFTQKGDKFVEYFFDEHNIKKKNPDEISIEDIPF